MVTNTGKRTSSRGVPDRGDVVWLDFDPQAGHEQAGHRPAVVLSAADYNGRTGMALVCPISTKRKGNPFEVPLPPGLKTQGVVLADQIKAADWRKRGAKVKEQVPTEVVELVVDMINALMTE